MLIHQNYDPHGDNKMAFIHRNVGWYRKHFKLPADWQGSAVWIYFEGVFHEVRGAGLRSLAQAFDYPLNEWDMEAP